MAAEYFLYTTLYNNTLVDRSKTSFAPLPPDTGEIFIDYFIPQIQPLYYYRESGGTIVLNNENTIQDYLIGTASPPNTFDTIDFYQLTGYTASTQTEIETAQKDALYGIGTGLLTGGTLSGTGSTSFNVGAGAGIFVDQYTNPTLPTAIHYDWSATTLNALNPSTESVTYVSIASGGTFVRRNSEPSPEDRRNEIFLGQAVHPNNVIIGFNNSPIPAYDIHPTTHDLMQGVGLFKVDGGNKIHSNDSGLKLRKTEGTIFKSSTNLRNNIKEPNFKTFSEQSPLSFFYRTVDGLNTALRTEIDPTTYELVDSGGTGSTIVTITGSSAQATAQRIYMYQTGNVVIQRGQNVYPTLQDAFSGFLNEDFVKEINIEQEALLIGVIVLRAGTTDISDTSDVVFVATDRYGSIIGASNSGFFNKAGYQLVRSLEDFPDPDINGNIQLQNNFSYEINGQVNIGANTLVLGNNNVIYGNNYNIDSIIGSGDTLIHTTGETLNMDLITLYNTNPTGKTFTCTESDAGSKGVFLRNIAILSQTVGELHHYSFVFLNNVQLFNTKNGFDIDSTTGGTTVIISDVALQNAVSGGTILTLTGDTYNGITIKDSILDIPSGSTGAYIPASSAMTITYGSIRNLQLIGDGIPLAGGLTKADRQWEFNNNLGVADSITLGFLKFVDNATETTIGDTATYYKAAGTNAVEIFERFVVTDNRLTYSGRTGTEVEIEILISGELSTNQNNQVIALAVYKNGTTKVGEVFVRADVAGDPESFAYNDINTLAVGEYLEVFVRNTTQAKNITVSGLQFRTSITGGG